MSSAGFHRNLPSEQKEVVAAKVAAVGLAQPEEDSLKFTAYAHASKLYRFAVGTTRGGLLILGATHRLGRLRGTNDCRADVAVAGGLGVIDSATAATAGDSATGFPICPNLLGCSQIGLRHFDILFCTGHLALVPLSNSLVH